VLALTCGRDDGRRICGKPATVFFMDGSTSCNDHDQRFTTENDFGIPQHSLGFVMDYDDHDKYVGTIPRLPMLADSI